LSAQGEKVVMSGFLASILCFLALGFGVLGAPPPVALLPFALAGLLMAVMHSDLRHVRRYGWGPGADGPSGRGDHSGPPEPTPPEPSGSGEPVDWDRFTAEFWDHVERERPRVSA
jgi:hypothetical protein